MTDQTTGPQRAKVNPVTWAVLNVYAGTAEGQARPSLGGFVRDHAPRGRLKSTIRMMAQGLGCLDTRGRLTPSGWQAARSALPSAAPWLRGPVEPPGIPAEMTLKRQENSALCPTCQRRKAVPVMLPHPEATSTPPFYRHRW